PSPSPSRTPDRRAAPTGVSPPRALPVSESAALLLPRMAPNPRPGPPPPETPPRISSRRNVLGSGLCYTLWTGSELVLLSYSTIRIERAPGYWGRSGSRRWDYGSGVIKRRFSPRPALARLEATSGPP